MNDIRDAPAPLVVVMGVSGCGKSTVARLLAEQLRSEFVEGDALHPPDNVARMAAGVPLTDDDRRGWLLTIAARLGAASRARQPLVVSCSALKRSYRDLLRGASHALAFVHLHGERALLEARMSARVDHFMPPSLLTSQLQTLELPGPDECAQTFDAALPPTLVAAQAAAWLATLPIKTRS
jgi:carbohydrate kinase (thermoresistant glucokinase family)